MLVLLTGATGFVGRPLLNRLLESGHRVRVMVRDPARLAEQSRSHQRLEAHRGTLTRRETLEGACRDVDAVVHVAGLVAARRAHDYTLVNVGGTAELAAVCARESPRARWIQVSSLAATGPGDPVEDHTTPRPISDYGRSKLAGEEMVKGAGLERWTILRPPAVYGPGDRGFLPFFRAAAAGRPCVLPAPGPAQLSLIHVGDLAQAIQAVLETPGHAEKRTFHVAHPDALALPEMVTAIHEAYGRKPRSLHVPTALGWGLAGILAPLRRLSGWPKYVSWDKMRELSAPAWHCRPEPFLAQYGWRPRHDLRAGVLDTARDYAARGWIRRPPAASVDSPPASP